MPGMEAAKIPPEERDRAILDEFMRKSQEFVTSLNPEEYDAVKLEKALRLLDQIQQERKLGGGQNETFVMQLANGAEAVYKPSVGEKKEIENWNIAQGKAFVREWLAYQLELNLETNIIPATSIRTNAHGVGSVQEFITGSEPILTKFSSEIASALKPIYDKGRAYRETEKARLISTGKTEAEASDLARDREVEMVVLESDTATPVWQIIEKNANNEQLIAMAINDFLIENNDRGLNNIMIDSDGNVFGIDNGASFPERPVDWIDSNYPQYYRTQTIALKQLGGREIPPQVLGKLEWFNATPERQNNMKAAMLLGLGTELGEQKWQDFQSRLAYLLENKKVPSSMYEWAK